MRDNKRVLPGDDVKE